MKRITTALLAGVLLIAINLYAGESGIDRRENVLKVDSLNILAANSLDASFIVTEQLADSANKLAREDDYKGGIIESTIIKCSVLINTNRVRAALSSLDELTATYFAYLDSAIIGKINGAKGNCYYYLGEYDSAKYFYNLAIQKFKTGNQLEKLANVYIKSAKVYLQTGETKRAGAYNEDARIIFEKLKDEKGLAWSNEIFGEVLQSQRLYMKSEIIHKENYKIFHKSHSIAGEASSQLHIGNSFYMQVLDDSAKLYYSRALRSFQILGDSNGIAICYSNLSRVMLEKDNVKLAIEYADKTLATIKDGGYRRIETATLQQLGDIYLELEQYDKSLSYVEKALLIAREINNKTIVLDCYKSLSEIYAAMKKPIISYNYLLLAYHLKDSIQPIAFSQRLAAMQDELESQKRETKVKALEQNNKIKTLEIYNQAIEITKRNIIIISSLLIFALAGGIFYSNSQKQKFKNSLQRTKDIRATEETERLRFAKDVHDELGSGLSKINFLSEIIVQSNDLSTNTKQTATSISETAKGLIGNMRDLIWALNPEQTTMDTLLANIREYASDYLEDYPAALKFNFPQEDFNFNISKESHREIFMTLKESLNNIVKHSKATQITVTVLITEKEFYLSVNDNGSGMDANNLLHGHGINNMKGRIGAIGGVFSLKSDTINGTTLDITVPILNMGKI